VLWALWRLEREGTVRHGIDVGMGLEAALAAYRAFPDTGSVVPSYFLGKVGILLALWQVTGSAQAADEMHAAIAANIDNPTNEALWAAPGTMLAALRAWQATGEARWSELYLKNVDRVWRTWTFDEAKGCWLWTQDLYGRVLQYLGAGHGFAGNVYALLEGAELLDDERREALHARCVQTLEATARRDGDAFNWPPTTRPDDTKMLVQWCHGAPGIVTASSRLQRSAAADALLEGAGQTVWTAGPLTKGAGLCHGTAGNGYAFLKLNRRTGESAWLDRARSFAMHALRQVELMRADYRRGRHTLWTGDPGVALYLWDCIRGGDAVCGLD
jgi:lantibiotic modifying enzyme